GLPSDGMDGGSLRAALVEGRAPSRPQYAETLYPLYHLGWSDLRAATDERYSYIRAPRPELFDLSQDPGEKRNLAAARASTAAAMAAWLDGAAVEDEPGRPEAVPDDVREKLRALGYLTGGPASGAASARGEKPDPKDRIQVYEALRHAMAL